MSSGRNFVLGAFMGGKICFATLAAADPLVERWQIFERKKQAYCSSVLKSVPEKFHAEYQGCLDRCQIPRAALDELKGEERNWLDEVTDFVTDELGVSFDEDTSDWVASGDDDDRIVIQPRLARWGIGAGGRAGCVSALGLAAGRGSVEAVLLGAATREAANPQP